MEINPEFLKDLRVAYGEAQPLTEGGLRFIHFPKFQLPSGRQTEALLLLDGAAPYTTRLFLTEASTDKASNWSQHQLFGRTWWTWSWKDVPAELPYAEILLNHVRALR